MHGEFINATVEPKQLSSRSSRFVDAIHTDTIFVGAPYLLGHVDFFPNNAKLQPGCPDLQVFDVINSELQLRKPIPLIHSSPIATHTLDSVSASHSFSFIQIIAAISKRGGTGASRCCRKKFSPQSDAKVGAPSRMLDATQIQQTGWDSMPSLICRACISMKSKRNETCLRMPMQKSSATLARLLPIEAILPSFSSYFIPIRLLLLHRRRRRHQKFISMNGNGNKRRAEWEREHNLPFPGPSIRIAFYYAARRHINFIQSKIRFHLHRL